jgi:hypothetical protein
MQRLHFLLAISLVAALSPAGLAQSDQTFEPVSLVALLANPEKYDNKNIALHGVAYFDSKNKINGVFLTREDKEKANGLNAVFVIFSSSVKNPDQFNNKFVLVQGRFSASDKGHLGSFSGTLKDVIRVQPSIVKIN